MNYKRANQLVRTQSKVEILELISRETVDMCASACMYVGPWVGFSVELTVYDICKHERVWNLFNPHRLQKKTLALLR